MEHVHGTLCDFDNGPRIPSSAENKPIDASPAPKKAELWTPPPSNSPHFIDLCVAASMRPRHMKINCIRAPQCTYNYSLTAGQLSVTCGKEWRVARVRRAPWKRVFVVELLALFLCNTWPRRAGCRSFRRERGVTAAAVNRPALCKFVLVIRPVIALVSDVRPMRPE
ncbi:unnamed protein product, partial [Iphiclides podalirius]